MSNLSFEESLIRLEEIINKLEKEELTLDESLSAFEEGISLYRLCSNELGKAEQKINQIIEENGELKSIPFKHSEEE